MTKEHKENLQNKIFTESFIIACLAICDSIISKNAYLEKKWNNEYKSTYKAIRLEWMGYREKLRAVLLKRYGMKDIIAMTKSCEEHVTQKAVKEAVELIDNKDYVFIDDYDLI